MALRHLDNAARYSHQVITPSKSRVFDAGPPEAVVTAGPIRELFGVEADVVSDRRTGFPLCIPYGLRQDRHPSRVGRAR